MVFLCFMVISLYCLLVIDRFYASIVESLGVLSCYAGHFTTSGITASVSEIGVRETVSKTTTTTKYEVEKFDGNSNFLLWKMRVMSLLVKEGTHKASLSIEKKPSKMGWWWVKRQRLSRKDDDHNMPISWGPLQRHEREDNCWTLV